MSLFSRRSVRSRAVTSVAVCALLSSANAYGQSSSTEKGAVVLPPVSVEGNADRLPPAYAGGSVARGGSLGILGNVDYMDAPFSITSYTAEMLKNIQAITLTQVLESSATVRRTGGRFASNDDISIRGFSVTTSDVGYDGVYGLGTFRRLPLEGVERVELLKGPSALLNGVPPEGGVGGLINLVPKRAGATPVTDVTASFASESYFGGHVDIGRRFGSNDAFGVRVNLARSGGDTPLDNNSEDMTMANLALDYAGERFRLFAHINYDDYDQDASNFSGPSIAAGIDVPSPPDNTTNFNAPFTKTYTTRFTNLFSAEYDITDSWMAKVSYGFQRGDETQFIAFGTRINNAAGDMTGATSYRLRPGDYDYDTIDGKLTGNFTTGPVSHRVVFAGYWLDRHFDSYTQNATIPAASVGNFSLYTFDARLLPVPNFTGVPTSRSDNKLVQDGFALSDTITAFDDRLHLTVGGRYQHIKNKNNLTGVVDYDETGWSPAAAVSFRVTQEVSVYGNYIQGLSRGPTAPSTAVNALEVFPPAKTEQKEIGTKLDLGNFGATLALFEITRPSGVTDPATNIFSVDGEQRNRGVELETFGNITPELRVLAGAAYVDAVLTKTQGGLTDGRKAAAAPQWRFNLSGEWDLPFVSGLTLTGQFLYTDEQFLSTANTQKIGSWTRVDAGARYAFDVAEQPVTVRFRVTNLLDKNYWETTGFALGEPRTVSVSISTSF